MLVIPKTHRCRTDVTQRRGFILFQLAQASPLPHVPRSCKEVLVVGDPWMSIMARVYSKQQAGSICVSIELQSYCGLYIIVWCWESYNKLNFCSLLPWWSLEKGWACNLGLQVSWRNNLETLVLLRISLEIGARLSFCWGATWKLGPGLLIDLSSNLGQVL